MTQTILRLSEAPQFRNRKQSNRKWNRTWLHLGLLAHSLPSGIDRHSGDVIF